jgi:hypothetical protein
MHFMGIVYLFFPVNWYKSVVRCFLKVQDGLLHSRPEVPSKAMPVTPDFSVSQDDAAVVVRIRVPHVRVSEAEVNLVECYEQVITRCF